MRANAPREIANFAQNRLGCKHARGIVKVCYHDEAGLRRDATAKIRRIDRPTVFFSPLEPLHVHLQIMGNVENRPIGWTLDQNFVAGFHDRCHGEMIRH